MTARQIRWTELLGNKYRLSLHPWMLREIGYPYETKALAIGDSNNKREAKACVVLFDEEYVIEWIVKKVLMNLKPASYNEFQKLLSKVWKRYQEVLNNGEQALLASHEKREAV